MLPYKHLLARDHKYRNGRQWLSKGMFEDELRIAMLFQVATSRCQ
jgi:hypothetical protein